MLPVLKLMINVRIILINYPSSSDSTIQILKSTIQWPGNNQEYYVVKEQMKVLITKVHVYDIDSYQLDTVLVLYYQYF